MELVKACQREDLFVPLIIGHANGAVVLLRTLLLSCTAVTLLLATREATPWQLGKQRRADGLLVVAHKKLVHVVSELLLVHSFDSCVFSHTSRAPCVLQGPSRKPEHGKHAIELLWALPCRHVSYLAHDVAYL